MGSLRWVLFAVVLSAQAQPASTPVLRSFDRVLLLEEKGETSAGVSVADLNGDGWQHIAAARSDTPNGIWFITKPGGGT